jgi:hypothetical protein
LVGYFSTKPKDWKSIVTILREMDPEKKKNLALAIVKICVKRFNITQLVGLQQAVDQVKASIFTEAMNACM